MKVSHLLLVCLLLLLAFVAHSASTEEITKALEEFVNTESEGNVEILDANQQSVVETLATSESQEPIIQESEVDLEETL